MKKFAASSLRLGNCHYLSALKDAILDLEPCLNHNYVQGALVIAGGMMSFHYRPVVSLFGGCSLTVATGPSATGKTSVVKAFLDTISNARTTCMSLVQIEHFGKGHPFLLCLLELTIPVTRKENQTRITSI